MRSRACCCLSHRTALITGSVRLAPVFAMLAGCQALPANVANCSVTPTPPANTSLVPSATEPPAALCAFPLTLTIATPRNGASVHCPVPIVANAAAPDRITRSDLRGWRRGLLHADLDDQSIHLDAERTTYRGNGCGSPGISPRLPFS
jgi:hypothetical protein